ncbi:putative serine/threonine-protein kinase [Gracilariopsis chorda]|uniref:Putative serine/threonine-protein kinase n=1 Tax=Gracilariopsis chorda TaxID=448386 RepID=A0A2V3IGU3_9FLOR|nr:putative serine/threonine-protein kinase [Gracilariopsis chorda]|eukprot:PXF41258.1 putative serine/threonine-protein kinase [Gracilariopsis chorda]
MDENVRRALDEEETHFTALKKAKSPSHCIIDNTLKLNNQNDLQCRFETADGTAYTFRIIIDDPADLSWTACRAICDVMQLAVRGTSMTRQLFQDLVAQLSVKYGKVDGPTIVNDECIALIFPNPSKTPIRDPNTIVRTGLYYNDSSTVTVKSKTKCQATYVIEINLQLDAFRYTKLCNKALFMALNILETGDVLYPDRFLSLGLILRQHLHRITPEASSSNKFYKLAILPTTVHSPVPIPSLLLRAAIAEASGTEYASSYSETANASQPPPSQESSLHCPYAGITYLELLKESGQARVYLGMKGDEKVAIKVYLDCEEQDDFFKNELKLLLKMSDHPNVVRVHTFFALPKPAIVMEYIDGQDLLDYLSDHGSMSNNEGKKLVLGIADGLYHLHKSGIIHRDLKTPNIMRRSDGSPVIIDLGMSAMLNRSQDASVVDLTQTQAERIARLARRAAETYSSNRTRTGKGSLLWIAPEMVLNNDWSDRTDVHAFGIIMWEIFSGKLPFLSDIPHAAQLSQEEIESTVLNAIVQGVRPSLADVSEIDDYLKSTMQLCWHSDPRERPTMMRVVDILRGNDPQPLFNHFDSDNSGFLEFPEFAMFLERYAPGDISPDDMLVLFKAVDTNQSGSICFSEFEKFWAFVQSYGLLNFISIMSTSTYV